VYAREIQDERSRTERSRTDEEIQEIQKRSRTDEVITVLRTGVTSSVLDLSRRLLVSRSYGDRNDVRLKPTLVLVVFGVVLRGQDRAFTPGKLYAVGPRLGFMRQGFMRQTDLCVRIYASIYASDGTGTFRNCLLEVPVPVWRKISV